MEQVFRIVPECSPNVDHNINDNDTDKDKDNDNDNGNDNDSDTDFRVLGLADHRIRADLVE